MIELKEPREPREAPRFENTTRGRSLINFACAKESFGSALPEYAQSLLCAAQCLSGMGVFEDEILTREAARFVLHETRRFLDLAENQLEKESEKAKETMSQPQSSDYLILGETSLEDIPDALSRLRTTANCILGMIVGDDPRNNLEGALRLIGQVRYDLDRSEKELREALADLGLTGPSYLSMEENDK